MMVSCNVRRVLAGPLVAGWLFVLVGCAWTPLTEERLQAAEKKWAMAGIQSYRLAAEVEVFSLASGYYEIEVRGGEVVQTVKGKFPDGPTEEVRPQAGEHVTVPGVFEECRCLLEEMAEHSMSSDRSTVTVNFDSRYGFVRGFVATDPTVSDGFNTRFRLVRFEVIPEE